MAADYRLPPPHETLADGITIRDLVRQAMWVLRFLRANLFFMFVCGVAGALLGATLGIVMPAKATAKFSIRLIGKVQQNPVGNYERENVAFFASAEQNFASEFLVRSTLEKMGVKEPSDKQVDDVQRRLKFYPLGNNTFVGQYTDKTSSGALGFLQTHVQNYLDTEIGKTLLTIQTEADFLKVQLKQIEADLKQSETDLKDFKENNSDGLPDQAREHYTYLRATQQRKTELEAKLESTRLELKLNKDKLTGEKLFVESKVISTQRAQPYQDAMVRVSKDLAEAKAAKLRDEHPEVIRLTELAKYLQKMNDAAKASSDTEEVEKRRNPIYESIQDAIYQLEVVDEVTSKELEQVIGKVARAQKIVDKLPVLEQKFVDITRNYSTNQRLHDKVYEQLRTAEVQVQLEHASLKSRYDVIAPPSLDYVSVSRSVLIKAVLFGFLGGFLALSWSIAVELKRYILGLV